MMRETFEIQMLPGARCVFRRPQEGREKEFPSLNDALDYAAQLPGGDDAQKIVVAENGRHLMRVVW